jgi:integrase
VVAFEEGISRILKRHEAAQKEERLAWSPGYHETGQVFAEPDGSTKIFNALKKRAGLGPEVGMHTLRHTAATLTLLEGVHLRVVQEMLGHKDISETMNRYPHVLPTMRKSAAQRIEAALF